MKVTFNPSGVCCREMIFEVDENNVIVDAEFIGDVMVIYQDLEA